MSAYPSDVKTPLAIGPPRPFPLLSPRQMHYVSEVKSVVEVKDEVDKVGEAEFAKLESAIGKGHPMEQHLSP